MCAVPAQRPALERWCTARLLCALLLFQFPSLSFQHSNAPMLLPILLAYFFLNWNR